jgi:hypothetical protein
VAVFVGSFLIGSLLLLAGADRLQQPIKVPRLEVASGPDLSLGEGRLGEHLTGEILIQNSGEETLQIENVNASCSCSDLTLERDILPPGGRTVVKVGARLRKEGQSVSFAVTIRSNDPSGDPARVLVKAICRSSQISVDPASLDFGEVPRATRPVARVRLSDADGRPIARGTMVTFDPIGARVGVLDGIPPASVDEKSVLDVSLPEGLELGSLSGEVRLLLPDGRRSNSLAVSGMIVPNVVPSPSALVFPRARAGQGAVHRDVLIRRTDGQPLGKIKGIELPPGLKAEEVDAGATPRAPAPLARRKIRVTLLEDGGLLQDGSAGMRVRLEGPDEVVAVKLLAAD